MKNYILLLFLCFNNVINFPKGINFRHTFSKFKENIDYAFKHIQKSHWQEILGLIKIINPKIVPKNSEIKNPTHIFFGVILNKIEDAQIFQKISQVNVIKIPEIQDLKMFSSSNIIESFRNKVKDDPFLVINTNELSKEKNDYLKKYYFAGGYHKNLNEKKIIQVSVSNDKIEDINIFPSLFSSDDKILFLNNLKNFENLYGKDIGFFFNLLGPALNILSFSKGEIILTYGDVHKCVHQKLQEIAFLLFFDKNYNFSYAKIIKKNLCSLCQKKSKVYTNSNTKRVEQFNEALSMLNPKTRIKEFYHKKISFIHREYFHLIKNIDINEMTLINFKEALIFAKEIFENSKYKFNYPWDHYENLIKVLFDGKNSIKINELACLFDESNHILDEFYIKPEKNVEDNPGDVL
jgi:hypothetical protein